MATDKKLHELTTTEAARAIREKKLSAVDLMEALLERSRKFESRLHVWVTLDERQALEAAKQSQRELEKSGPKGPLHGVSAGIKDTFYTKGMKTTFCSPIYADHVPDYDATSVAKLREAGAIIMGKAVTTQFAYGDPSPTRNPWNAQRTPGGSSSGSATGVAAGFFPMALGSQTAGSVLRPACYNGVVGLKPTLGRMSRHGVIPDAWSVDTIGTFSRSVEDAALLLNVLSGLDPNDPISSPLPVPDFTKALRRQKTGPRIGIMRQFFLENAVPETREHIEGVAKRLEKAGASVRELRVDMNMDTLQWAHRVMMAVEGAAVHEKDFSERPDDYAPDVRRWIEMGQLIPAVTYANAQRVRGRFRRLLHAAMADVDVVLTSTSSSPAPDVATTGDPRWQAPFTTAGFPAISLPSGLSKDGLPHGTQLVAKPFEEETLIAAAAWCERVVDIKLPPPF
ncbi:MAG: amidase [SAR202 cluster bacterium]|nr:amidase [SAR202 cluster bacterium]